MILINKFANRTADEPLLMKLLLTLLDIRKDKQKNSDQILFEIEKLLTRRSDRQKLELDGPPEPVKT